MEAIGIVYPIPKEIMNSLFNEKKSVFVKFTHQPSKKTIIRIKEGMKLYLYESHSENCFVGEADISKVSYLLLEDILKKYREKLIISEKDLREYAQGRESKMLLVLNLVNIKKYDKPRKSKKRITMAGHYITLENKKEVFW